MGKHQIEEEEEISEKGGKKKKKKLNPLIKGDYKGVAYKISRTSKFISSTEVINHHLHKVALNQVKKDAQQHGTYSVNPFAMYPKHIKNTIATLLATAQGGSLLNTRELQKPFENAFIDLVKKEKDEKNMDIKLREKQLEQEKEKKRFFVSTYLDKSFYIKNIFEVWYHLHQQKGYDRIQAYLEKRDVTHN